MSVKQRTEIRDQGSEIGGRYDEERRVEGQLEIVSQLLDPHPYRPLPPEVLNLCRKTNAPPRLIAHLILVHDAASRLIEELMKAFPAIEIDADEVLFGAATHDLGKTIHREELRESGHLHERAGMELLEKLGVSKAQARFAYTHKNWKDTDPPLIEDLLVALADCCWKGKRKDELEMRLAEMLGARSDKPEWECFAALDDIIQKLAADADARLSWQKSFPVD